jgi:hypothetical protein
LRGASAPGIVQRMRFHPALALTLFLAACATRPEQQAPAPAPLPPAPQPAVAGQLIGKTSSDLIGQFGTPALRIQEGTSLKLQFRAPECILDAYLYPSGGTMRVTHVDARYPSGADYNQAACIVVLTDVRPPRPL